MSERPPIEKVVHSLTDLMCNLEALELLGITYKVIRDRTNGWLIKELEG